MVCSPFYEWGKEWGGCKGDWCTMYGILYLYKVYCSPPLLRHSSYAYAFFRASSRLISMNGPYWFNLVNLISYPFWIKRHRSMAKIRNFQHCTVTIWHRRLEECYPSEQCKATDDKQTHSTHPSTIDLDSYNSLPSGGNQSWRIGSDHNLR